MARNFNGSSDFINSGSSLILSPFNKLSISFWFASNAAVTSTDLLVMELSTNTNTNTGAFFVNPNSSTIGGDMTWRFNNGGTINVGFPDPTPTLNFESWHHYLLLIDGTQTGNAAYPAGYLDGVSQTLTFNGTGGSATNFGNFTLYFMSRAGTSLFQNGKLADLALFGGTLLNSTQARALGAGARPNQIGAIPTYWWPFDGYGHPALDRSIRNNNGVLTGTTFVTGPPLLNSAPIMLTTVNSGEAFLKRSPLMVAAALPKKVAAASSVVFRKTLSQIGGRVGTRQIQGWAN